MSQKKALLQAHSLVCSGKSLSEHREVENSDMHNQTQDPQDVEDTETTTGVTSLVAEGRLLKQ